MKGGINLFNSNLGRNILHLLEVAIVAAGIAVFEQLQNGSVEFGSYAIIATPVITFVLDFLRKQYTDL